MSDNNTIRRTKQTIVILGAIGGGLWAQASLFTVSVLSSTVYSLLIGFICSAPLYIALLSLVFWWAGLGRRKVMRHTKIIDQRVLASAVLGALGGMSGAVVSALLTTQGDEMTIMVITSSVALPVTVPVVLAAAFTQPIFKRSRSETQQEASQRGR